MKTRQHILSIAGFDPSGGAGLMADVKTFEQHKLQGLSVLTANTIQTEDVFLTANWIDEQVVLEQLKTILNRYSVGMVKVGLIPGLDFLNRAIELLAPATMVVWDPILATSTGFDFNHCLSDLTSVLGKVSYITPNWNEIQQMTGEDPMSGATTLSKYTNVYLKGGHAEELGKDYLFTRENKYPFKMQRRGTQKHGSGCVFSSALASNLALGLPQIKACLKAKRYVEQRLASNKGNLAYHRL